MARSVSGHRAEWPRILNHRVKKIKSVLGFFSILINKWERERETAEIYSRKKKKQTTTKKNFETFVEEPLAQLSEWLKQIILARNANFKANAHLNKTALDNIQSI